MLMVSHWLVETVIIMSMPPESVGEDGSSPQYLPGSIAMVQRATPMHSAAERRAVKKRFERIFSKLSLDRRDSKSDKDLVVRLHISSGGRYTKCDSFLLSDFCPIALSSL